MYVATSLLGALPASPLEYAAGRGSLDSISCFQACLTGLPLELLHQPNRLQTMCCSRRPRLCDNNARLNSYQGNQEPLICHTGLHDLRGATQSRSICGRIHRVCLLRAPAKRQESALWQHWHSFCLGEGSHVNYMNTTWGRSTMIHSSLSSGEKKSS